MPGFPSAAPPTLTSVKFTDGYWQLRSGVSARYPAQVYDVTADADSLTVYAPTRPIRQRGDTLNQPLITVRCSVPGRRRALGVGRPLPGRPRPRRPQFAVQRDPAVSVRPTSTENEAVITSGALSARFRRGDSWALEFVADGKLLTSSGNKAMALLDTEPDGRYVREQLGLDVGEFVYGLGERFGPVVKNGQTVDIWNADGGTSSEQAYKNVPFYLTNRGLRRLRQPSGPGLVRGRLRGGVPGAVQRARRGAGVPGHLRPDARGDPAQVHRA